MTAHAGAPGLVRCIADCSITAVSSGVDTGSSSPRPRLTPPPRQGLAFHGFHWQGPWSSMGGSPKRLFALTYFRASNAPKRLLTVARAAAYLRAYHVFLVQIGNDERHREPRLDSGADQAASQTRRRTDEGADDGSGAQIRGSLDRLLHAPGYRSRRGLGAGQQLHGDGDSPYNGLDDSKIVHLPSESAVEVDDMQQRCPGLSPPLRHGHRVIPVDGLLVCLPLQQTHAFAGANVNARDYLHALPPATASAEGAQFNGRPFPASVTAEGRQFNGAPSPGSG